MYTQPTLTVDPNIEKAYKQELCPRLTLESSHHGKIWIFTFSKKTRDDQVTSRMVIDIWVETIKRKTDDLPAGSTWYRLNDFSQTDMHPSPYFVTRLSEISKYRPSLKGHSAFVIPKNVFTRAILNLSWRIRPKHVQVRLFFQRDEALQWLETELTKEYKQH
jgi:hypothetical protein